MKKLIPSLMAGAVLGLLATTPIAATADGGIWVTGHDSDWHAIVNGIGPQHIVQTSINFVTNHKSNPKILFVTDKQYIGFDSMDTQNGLTVSGFPNYTLADDGTNFADVGTVNFSNYDAIVVASSGGGLLHQSELDKLNARAGDIVNYINGGGGLVAFAESNEYPGGTKHDFYGFLPFVVAANSLPQGESSFHVTPFGAGLGLTNSDVQSAFAHNTFAKSSGMNIVDQDGAGNIISLAFYGKIGITGVGTPEPGTLALAGAALLVFGRTFCRRRKA